MILTWNEALEEHSRFPKSHKDFDTYKEGYRSGWLDKCLGHKSMIALTSPWGAYSSGYRDGQIDYKYYSPLEEEGGVICLKHLLS